jgi:hypothetical protein
MKIINGKRIHEIELTDEHLLVLHEGLMSVPFGRAAPVVNHINAQLPKPEAPPNLSLVPTELPPLPEGADYIRHQGGMPRADECTR